MNELAVEEIALDLSQATFSLDNMEIYLNITSAVNKLLSALTRESKVEGPLLADLYIN